MGYSQRPKTEAQAYQPTVPQTQPAATMETPAMTEALELTQVKGIGEKRSPQLKAIGISSVNDLAKASAEDIAKNSGFPRRSPKNGLRARRHSLSRHLKN